MPVDKFGRMSDTKTRDTGVSLTYINNNYIRSDGNTPVSGSIDMRGNTLYNVSDPVNPQDVATKEYADNKRPHIIAVHTHYYGPLIKGKYQFTFGENDNHPELSGFLIPHSGCIKKIAKILIPYSKLTGKMIVDGDFGEIHTLAGSFFFFFFFFFYNKKQRSSTNKVNKLHM